MGSPHTELLSFELSGEFADHYVYYRCNELQSDTQLKLWWCTNNEKFVVTDPDLEIPLILADEHPLNPKAAPRTQTLSKCHQSDANLLFWLS